MRMRCDVSLESLLVAAFLGHCCFDKLSSKRCSTIINKIQFARVISGGLPLLWCAAPSAVFRHDENQANGTLFSVEFSNIKDRLPPVVGSADLDVGLAVCVASDCCALSRAS